MGFSCFTKLFTTMAKGNLFLGTGRGSVGDTTFYRRNGQQVSRVRVRRVGNPRTNGQIIQRAILSTVGLMYSKGKAIFDHSFEGYKVGTANMQRFMSLNLRKLRENYASDVENNRLEDESVAKLVGYKSTAATPNEYIISEGSFRQPRCIVEGTGGIGGEVYFHFPTSALPNATIKTIALFLDAMGMREGDIETLCVLGCGAPAGSNLTPGIAPTASEFAYLQLEVKAGLNPDTAVTTSTTVGDIFNVYGSNMGIVDVNAVKAKTLGNMCQTADLDETVVVTALMDNGSLSVGCTGLIASRRDTGVRSNTTMKQWLKEDCGLCHLDIVDNWQSAVLGDSDLVLEGSNF